MTTNYASSRHLLPMEMLLGCVCVCVGIAGGFGHGELHRSLVQFSAASAWMWMLLINGAAMIAIASAAISVRVPRDGWALALARARLLVGVLSVGCWTYAIQFSARVDGWSNFPVTAMIIFPALVFSAWSVFANTKVRVALDPRAQSPGLKYDRRHV